MLFHIALVRLCLMLFRIGPVQSRTMFMNQAKSLNTWQDLEVPVPLELHMKENLEDLYLTVMSRVPTRRATERPMSPVEGLREQLRRVPSGGTAIPYVPTIAPSEAPSRAPPHGEPFTREAAIPVSRTPPPVIVPEPTIRPAVSPPPRTVALAPSAQSGPGDLLYENAEREREEHFGDLERRMHDLIGASQEAEENRDANFRANEDERDRIFVQNERRRDEEAIQRRDEIWRELEDRLATLAPAAGEAPILFCPQEAPAAPAPDVASLLDVASRHSEELRDIVAAEREEFQRELAEQRAERDRALAELKATHDQIEEELRARIQLLTNELDSVRADLTRERELRSVEEMDRHERERAEMLEHDEAMRKQLSDITELVSEQRDEMANKREVMDQRWAETQERNEHKDAMCAELRRMVEQIIEQKEAEREEREQERARAAEQPTLQSILDTILQENASHRERLDQLANDWRADCERHKEETIASVRATANEQVPFNVQAYLDDFSRSLASEVRMLLGEVGKLREERRNLQFELGCMLTMKSKYGPGGEFDPDCERPTTGPCAAGAAEPPPPEAPPPPEEPIAAPSGWRPLHRGTRRQRTQQRAAAAPPPPPQPEVPPPAHLRGNMQSWATWLPDPNSDVTPPIRPSTLVVQTPSPPGLFGPRSPRGSLHQ
ncbi:hypothetical protein A0H81_03304 [Grifola frondosa]|uniref:Reticulocyte-binding protein 2 a n=1 Tax=Grifola frondosa TaxID=5627 RepID=A0A1C7MI96_GRIFR|nr:hypothetical protein A0H81_03304 [Grifola frondosa]